MIRLEMMPQDPPLSWEKFCEVSGPFSVAIDGCVSGGPRFDPAGPRISFNHHEEVNRLATRATCAQVLLAIRQGLFGTFRDDRGARAVVYANDCDEDVCTSWFLLKNHHLCAQAMNPSINRLVHAEDMLDATAGAYPFPADLPLLEALAWVFEPYRRARTSGELGRKDAATFAGIVTDVENRIMRYVMGTNDWLPLDTRYELVGVSFSAWAMVREIGAQARTGMFASGIRAYVSVRERPGGGYTYTVGRMSQLVPFPVEAILEALNEAEGLTGSADRWGGGDTIGGSPRVAGSRMPPEEVARIVQKVCTRGRDGQASSA